MDERERIRRELEEEERLDAIDPLRHLLHAGVELSDEEEQAEHQGEDVLAEVETNHAALTDATQRRKRRNSSKDVGAHQQQQQQQLLLRYKLNDGNDVVPAQRAAVEGDLRAVVRYYARQPLPPITFGLSALPLHQEAASHTFFDVHLHQDVSGGCGGRIWPAAEVLGAYLARRPEFWRERWADKQVLELGSGTGLLGLLCARAGMGQRVIITDQDAMLDLMQRNLTLNEEATPGDEAGGAPNGLPTPCVVRELNWGEPLPTDVPPKPEVLLLADCVYLEVAFQPLVDTMVELSTPETEILFCYQKRRKADKRFFTLLKKHFHFDHVDDDDAGRREVYNREGTQLLRVVKKK